MGDDEHVFLVYCLDFKIFGKPSRMIRPAERPLDLPTHRQDLKFRFDSFGNVHRLFPFSGDDGAAIERPNSYVRREIVRQKPPLTPGFDQIQLCVDQFAFAVFDEIFPIVVARGGCGDEVGHVVGLYRLVLVVARSVVRHSCLAVAALMGRRGPHFQYIYFPAK